MEDLKCQTVGWCSTGFLQIGTQNFLSSTKEVKEDRKWGLVSFYELYSLFQKV